MSAKPRATYSIRTRIGSPTNVTARPTPRAKRVTSTTKAASASGNTTRQ
jgi:hypothetical protein